VCRPLAGSSGKGTTTISDCAVLNTDNEIYELDSDISHSSTNRCMDIEGENITLDCQGHTIDGDGAADMGIELYLGQYDLFNATVKNCVLSDWDTRSIYANALFNSTLKNITIYDSADRGIHMEYSDYNLFQDIHINNSGDEGIYSYRCEDTHYKDLISENSQDSDFYYDTTSDSECNHIVDNFTLTGGHPLYFTNETVNWQHWDNATNMILCGGDYSVLNNITFNSSIPNSLLVITGDVRYSNFTNIRIEHLHRMRGRANQNTYVNNYYSNIYLGNNTGTSDSFLTINGKSGTFENITLITNPQKALTYVVWIVNNADAVVFANSTIQVGDESDIPLRISTSSSDGVKVYNCLINATTPIDVWSGAESFFNTTNQSGTPIYGNGNRIGGNYWTNSSGSGYSDTCTDSGEDGFCDTPFNATTFTPCSGSTCNTDATDYLPLSKIEPGEDTCTCAGLDTNWEVDMADNCVITDDCNLGTGTLNFTGTGWMKCDAEINTTNLGDPGSGGTLYILDDCTINVGS
jgi:hypothetical protein